MSHFKSQIENKINKKTLTMTMSDNSKWAIPVWVIVLHRADDLMNDKDINSFYKELSDTITLFNAFESKLIAWVSTFMKWDDVKDYAVRIEPELNFDHEWLNSAKELS